MPTLVRDTNGKFVVAITPAHNTASEALTAFATWLVFRNIRPRTVTIKASQISRALVEQFGFRLALPS